jgi:hypothetical protein
MASKKRSRYDRFPLLIAKGTSRPVHADLTEPASGAGGEFTIP